MAVDGWVWQPFATPLVLVIVGGLITVMTGWVQIRRFPLAVRMVFRGAMKQQVSGEGTITQFQALSTALASTVGNGNIGGVATAILIGGPGAVFWMWVTAALGMATKYAEAVLGVRYRVTRETGEMASGPMCYMRGIPIPGLAKVLAYLFAFFGACAALFGTGNMAQSNTVARTFVEAARSTFGLAVPVWIPGLLITVAVGLVLLGGIRRIAAVAERLVPTMIALYVLTTTAYILLDVAELPRVFGLIVTEAFTPTAAVGGFVGASVAQTIAAGVSRRVLSNEAGMGSAPIAHGIAKVNHPSEQGVVGIFEVFTDTIVICSMTAFVIISSGLWTDVRLPERQWGSHAGRVGHAHSVQRVAGRGLLFSLRILDADRLVLLRGEVFRVPVRVKDDRPVPRDLHRAHHGRRRHLRTARVGTGHVAQRVDGAS